MWQSRIRSKILIIKKWLSLDFTMEENQKFKNYINK